MLDVRLPIGWLFLVLGVMLAVYGYANPPAESLRLGQVLLPLNLDVPWGILMALFGLAMVSLAQIDKIKALEQELKVSPMGVVSAAQTDVSSLSQSEPESESKPNSQST